MRALFLLAVAANIAFIAWAYYFSSPEGALDRNPLQRQVNPEKLKILSPTDLPAVPAAKPKPAPESAAPSCIEWGSFSIVEAARAEQAVVPLALGARLSQRRAEETAGWWVYLPSQGSRQGAQKKVAELKTLGVEEYFVMQEEGRLRWAISLGVFSSEEAARSRLDALRARGVRGAQVGERETQVTKVSFQVRPADPALQAKLKEMAQGFPGTELRDCPG